MPVNFRLKVTKVIGQRKAFYRQGIPEFSRKETVDINILVTLRMGDDFVLSCKIKNDKMEITAKICIYFSFFKELVSHISYLFSPFLFFKYNDKFIFVIVSLTKLSPNFH